MRVVSGLVSHFGLGQRRSADVVRIVWTNGVPQNHIQPNSNQTIVEKQVLKGSCPFLYTWDGKQFVFLTDIMWKSALGMPLGIAGGSTSYAFPNSSDEFLKIIQSPFAPCLAGIEFFGEPYPDGSKKGHDKKANP